LLVLLGGPGYAGPVDRFASYDPATDPTRGHGLRFATDDLYDCAWQVTQSFAIQRELPPGSYVGRIKYTTDATHCYDVSFVVKRAAAKPNPAILVLCSTNTWLGYNVPFPNSPDATDGWSTGGPGVSVPGAPAFSMYWDHVSSGRPAFQMGLNVPRGIAAPYVRYLDPSYNYSHLLRAERYLHIWLERNGYDFDVATDLDLHQNPDLLSRYRVVVINGHSEYWSAQAYDGLQRYLQAGGKAVVASGNTIFWRVSFDASGTVMECRKTPSGNTGGSPNFRLGELWHSQDGQRGGLIRECGRPAWQVIGVDSVGWRSAVVDPFVVSNTGHSFFRTPEPIGLGNGAAIGLPVSVGHEYDVRLPSIPGSVSPPVPSNYDAVALAGCAVTTQTDGAYWDYRTAEANKAGGGPLSEIVDFRLPSPSTGRVLSIGSIAAGRGILGDANMSMLMRNVLHQFGVVHRLHIFTLGPSGQLRGKTWDGEAWSPPATDWLPMGGTLVDAPCSANWAPERISVTAVGSNGRLSYKWWNGASWQPSNTGFSDLGGALRARPQAVFWGGNWMNIFARAQSGEILNKWWDGASWGPSMTDWQSLGGTGTASPTAVSWRGNNLALAALSSKGSVLYKTWNGAQWLPSDQGWDDLGGTFTFGPTLFAWGGGTRLNIFAVDAAGQLFTRWWDGQAGNLRPRGKVSVERSHRRPCSPCARGKTSASLPAGKTAPFAPNGGTTALKPGARRSPIGRASAETWRPHRAQRLGAGNTSALPRFRPTVTCNTSGGTACSGTRPTRGGKISARVTARARLPRC
jgi:hypothetical protein